MPNDYVPSRVNKEDVNSELVLVCPFIDAGNPLPVCTWSRVDSNNISHQILNNRITNNYCIVRLLFEEEDNGLYQCTGHNAIGNTTYTFPEKFIVESK